MPAKVLCPECGMAIVVADAVIDEHGRCRCARHKSNSNGAGPLPALGSKRCIVCGEDLDGRKRYKDRAGKYWCVECKKADEEFRRGGSVQCPDCARWFSDEKLMPHGLAMVCYSCHKERTLIESKRADRRAITRGYSKEERSRLVKLIAIAALLLLVAICRFRFF